MTEKQIAKKAHEYIDTQLKKNPVWLDCITDSWIYDAENWFETYLQKKGIKTFVDDIDYDFTPEGQKLHDIFWDESFKYKKEKDIEINGVRDGLLYLKGCLYNIKCLKEKYNKALECLTPHFIGEPTIVNPPKVSQGYFDIPLGNIEALIHSIEILQGRIERTIEKETEKTH